MKYDDFVFKRGNNTYHAVKKDNKYYKIYYNSTGVLVNGSYDIKDGLIHINEGSWVVHK